VSRKPARRYSDRTLKILFTYSGNVCARPGCENPIIKNRTQLSDNHVLGQISHIHAASDYGPRADPSLSEEARNGPDNLILLCPTCHDVVDGQYETYPPELLKRWKDDHERQFRERMSATITDLGYAELDIAAKALLVHHKSTEGDLRSVPPADKIKKNGLNAECTFLLQLGSAKSDEVASVLIIAAQLDAGFPERLRAGFVAKYGELKSKPQTTGDDIFFSLYFWAAGGSSNEVRRGAGLCILSHLFILCDVFER